MRSPRERKPANEADVSTKSPTPEEDARLSGTHEDQRRAQGPQAAPRQGSQAADRLTARVAPGPPRAPGVKAAGDADAIRAGRLAAGPFQVVFKQGKRIEQPSFV